MSNRLWYEESMLSAGATRDPKKRRQYEEHVGRCRATMPAQAPACTCQPKQEEPPRRPAEESVAMNKKPTLLDIARRAVVEDNDARNPSDLASTIESWWVPGAKALGLTVSVYYNEEAPVQPPEIRAWCINEEKTRSWLRPDNRGFLPPEEHAQWRRPRELGETMEFQGRRYVLIGFIQTEHWSSGVVDSAAFVPAEEIQL